MKPADLIYRETAHPGPNPLVALDLAGGRVRPRGRSGGRPVTGLAISVGLHLALVGGLLFHTLHIPLEMAPPLPPMVVEMERAARPTPPEEVAPGPRQVERHAARPQPPAPLPLKPAPATEDPLPVSPPRVSAPADPGPSAPETTAPPVPPGPPAAQASSDVKATWEGQVLARLEKYRRFPDGARLRRQQGVVHVRFRMDRPGRVLWSRVERSSGFGELDRAALDTLRRAQPLPAIPAGRPDEIELVVPVEFFIAQRR